MPHPNPYTRYAAEAGVITQEVLSDPYFTVRATFGMIPGSREAFMAAGEYVHARIQCRVGETLPTQLRSQGVAHGMRVMARFAYQAASRAAELGISAPGLTEALTHPGTFHQTLEPIATQDDNLAAGLERDFGLWGEADTPDPSRLYVFMPDGSIALRSLDWHIKKRNIELLEAGVTLRERAICGAHRAGVLATIYQNIVPLYVQHPHLVPAVLNAPVSA